MGLNFQDCSIWLHSDRMLGSTEKLLVERGSVSEVMALPLDFLSHCHDVKRQECSLNTILLPKHQYLLKICFMSPQDLVKGQPALIRAVADHAACSAQV